MGGQTVRVANRTDRPSTIRASIKPAYYVWTNETGRTNGVVSPALKGPVSYWAATANERCEDPAKIH